METILELNQVTKDYGSFKLDGIDLKLERGLVMGLIGANGAGKTTVIRLIMNLIKKESGSIRIFGQDHEEKEKEIKERIGFVYDENLYPENLRLERIATLIAPFYSRWDWKRFDEYLKRFELDRRSSLAKLSKGMKTKFSIAMALSHDAELILMDEPTSGLDPVFRRELLDILRDLMVDGSRSILFSTHITSDLDRIADVITLIDHGKVALSMPYSEIAEQYRIVKGPRALLEQIDPSWLQGTRVGKFGFDALSRESVRIGGLFGDAVVFDKPSVEDIMVYHSRKDGEAGC